MAVEYLTIVAALERTKTRAKVEGTADDAEISELLELTIGKVGTVKHYRPFYVAAKWLEQDVAAQKFKSADGAVFSQQEITIASLLDLQAGYDKTYGLEVPAGFAAVPPDCKSCAPYATGDGSNVVGGRRSRSVRGRVG